MGEAIARFALDQALFCFIPYAAVGLLLLAANFATPRLAAWKGIWALWFALISLPLPLLIAGRSGLHALDAACDSARAAALSVVPRGILVAALGLQAIGAVTILCFTASRHLASRWIASQAKETSPPAEDAKVAILALASDGMGLERPPRLCMSELSPGPAATGIVRPLVIFPRSLADTLGRDGFSRVVSHEIAHHRGDDLLLALLADIALALNWFNPVAWFARSRLAMACEIVADRRALSLQDDGDWGAYAHAIVQVLRWKRARPDMPGASGLARDARETKNRIEALERTAVKRHGGDRNGMDPGDGAKPARSFNLPRLPGRISAVAVVGLATLSFTVAAARYSSLPATTGTFLAGTELPASSPAGQTSVPSVAAGAIVDAAGTGDVPHDGPEVSHAKNGDTAASRDSLGTTAVKSPLSGTALAGTPAFVRALDAAIDTMDWERARELAEIQFRRYPGDETASILMARIEMKDGNFNAVRERLEDAKNRSPTTLNLIARSFDYEGRRNEALRWYRIALDAQLLGDVHEAERRVIETGLDRPLAWRKAEPAPLPGAMDENETELTDRETWRASSIPDGGRARPELAIDGDIHTRFGNYIRMKPGMCLAVDFGKPTRISRVWLVDDAGGDTIFPFDYPRFWRLEVLVDGQGWKEVARGKGVPDRYAGAAFKPLSCSAIRFFQDSSTDGECWSVYEVKVAGPARDATGPANEEAGAAD